MPSMETTEEEPSSGGRGKEGKMWARACSVVSTGKNGQACSGSTSLNTFGWFWNLGAVPICLVPGPRVMRTEL